MHTHEFQDQPESARPRSARVDEAAPPAVARALAAHDATRLDAGGVAFLQRAAGNASTAALVDDERSPVLDVVSSGGGRPLEPGLRADMETRLGADFGDVRVHTDSAAASSASAVGAHAYTVGSNVVFQRDAYDPDSHAGRTTIAHELTHVMQQRSGPVDGTAHGDGVAISDPGDRFELAAAANAEHVMATPATPAQRAVVEPSVQREEDAAAAVRVQREGEEEELAEG